MPKIFLSHALASQRLPFAATPATEPASSQHWATLADAYRDGLLACGEQVVPILRPEIYQTGIAHAACGAIAGDWHLAIKPSEHIRPFHGLPNVFVSDWPFPTLSRQTGGISPFFHQVRLLNQAAAVACCTEATAAALSAAGVTRAVHAPPFRAACVAQGVSRFRPATPGCTVLAVAEAPSLIRLQAALVRGFAEAQAQHRPLRLILVVSGADPTAAPALRAELLAATGVADEDGHITVSALPLATALVQSQADFFLWGGTPLGLPLPLIDAALVGLPPIASGSAASAAGLSPGGFVLLATVPRAVEPVDEPVVQVMPLQHDAPTEDGVRDALLRAAALDDEARAALARCARRDTERGFGLEAFRAGLARLSAAIGDPT